MADQILGRQLWDATSEVWWVPVLVAELTALGLRRLTAVCPA